MSGAKAKRLVCLFTICEGALIKRGYYALINIYVAFSTVGG
jgi:hypothetical protein